MLFKLQSLGDDDSEDEDFFLLDLILYIPINNFSVLSERVFLGRASKDEFVLLKDTKQ